MSRRNQGLVDALQGFSFGYGAGRKFQADQRDDAIREGFKEVSTAAPVESDGYTADQGATLENAAKSGQYDIGTQTNEDGTFKAYTVTPKSEPTNTAVIAKRGVTDFLGNRTEGQLTDGQQDTARARAMAGVLRKNGDPLGAMRLEREARQGDREEQRFGWEQGRAQREEAGAQREDAWRTGREKLLQDSAFGQIQRENADAKRNYEVAMEDFNKRTAAGEQGLVAPQAPQVKQYGVGQAIFDNLTVAAHDVQHGKANPEALAKLAKARQDLEDEGYAKALRLAQGGAPIQQVLSTYNAGGKDKVQPEDLVSDQVVDRGNGIKSRVMVFKGKDGKPVTIDTMTELDALDKSDKLVDRVFKTRADDRAERSTNASVAQSQAQTGVLTQKLDDTKELGSIRTDLSAAIDAGDADGIAKGRAKLLSYMTSGKSGTQSMSAEERKANFYLASGLAKDMAEAARMAHEKVQTSAKDDYMTLMKPNSMGIAPTPDSITPIMEAMHGKDWLKKMGNSGPQGASFASEADAEAAAKAGKIKKGDRVTIGGKSGTWQ